MQGTLVILYADILTWFDGFIILGADYYNNQVVFLTDVFFHEVNFAYASILLFKLVNMCVESIPSQQRDKV